MSSLRSSVVSWMEEKLLMPGRGNKFEFKRFLNEQRPISTVLSQDAKS
jgi:hypothetical protein